MSTETVRLLLYCDGSVEYGLNGIQYNQPPRKSFRLSTGIRYAELVERVHSVLKISMQRYILRLMWRSPTLHQKYVLHPIEEDDDVEEILTFSSKFPDYRYVELYVFKEDASKPYGVGHTKDVQDSSFIAQQQGKTPLGFPIIEGVMPAVQSDDVVNNRYNIDSRGIESNESADDDYWPEYDDFKEERDENEESHGNVIVHEAGCSFIPVSSHPETLPTQVHDHQVFAHDPIPEFYHDLNLDDGGCISTRRELPFNSQFWD